MHNHKLKIESHYEHNIKSYWYTLFVFYIRGGGIKIIIGIDIEYLITRLIIIKISTQKI